MNDQYAGAWDSFFSAIELAVPKPAALGITDYFTLRGYKEFKRRRLAGQLPAVELVFPNVELRLTTETRTGKGINLHLLVSPDEPNHVTAMEERLARLTFHYLDTEFPCSDDGLRNLGRAQPGKGSLPDDAALKEGARQFKVELSDVRALFEKDAWVRANVLTAVAAGEDGLAGIASDAGFRAHREELGRKADLVFSGSPKERTYWLGEHPDFKANRQTAKPCLHGSDAHELARVLQPDQDRRCWIRGSATFESLRQTLAEPERRVFIGAEPPPGAPASEVIQSLQMENAPWLVDPDISFNSGLVTVIGAKGSGKTALADLIALAAGAEEKVPGQASFLRKARRLLATLTVHLYWADGSDQSSMVPSDPEPTDYPRVQYLSQQFVERLSAPDDLSEPLVEEIERVVFGAIPEEERLQTSTFAELRELILEDPLASQDHEREAIRNQTRVIAAEQDLERSLPALRSAAQAQQRARIGLESEIAKMPTKGGDEKLKALAAAAQALQSLRDAVAASDRRAQGIKDVAAEVRRQVKSTEVAWDELRHRHPDLLEAATWEALLPRVDAAALETLARLEQEARTRTEALKERGEPLPGAQDMTATPPSTARGLLALTADHERLSKELSLDEANAKRRLDLEKRLATAKADDVKAIAAVAHADGASARNREAQRKRLDSYHGVFDAMLREHDVLESIYAPLSIQIATDKRLSKLSLVVGRVVDLDTWVARGEALFDLRTPPFMGHGRLGAAARASLLDSWRSGKPDAVQRAMKGFIDEHLVRPRPALAQDASWVDVGEWLFSTEHIRVQYSIEYEGVPISRLSPGTRGVVLLTLYLGLDRWDLRPLVIDQPEENLDPSTVFDSLVPFFRDAAERRQIIMVTHNANLVVATDSDQVIVAQAKRGSPKSLPRVTYLAGGLEDAAIRAHVCRLLEGGEAAFRRRGQRYGIRG